MADAPSAVHPAVSAALAAAGLPHTVREHALMGRVIASPADFAEALGYPLARVTKSVFLAGRGADGFPLHAVAVCAMPDRLDFAAVSRAVGASGRLQVAAPDALAAVLGYPRNGVSPLGVPAGVRVVLDEGLLAWPTVLVGGGTTGVEVEAAPAALARACAAVVTPIAKPAV